MILVRLPRNLSHTRFKLCVYEQLSDNYFFQNLIQQRNCACLTIVYSVLPVNFFSRKLNAIYYQLKSKKKINDCRELFRKLHRISQKFVQSKNIKKLFLAVARKKKSHYLKL